MEEIRDSFRGVHCVIHCAALVSYSFPPDHDALHRINVTGTRNVVSLCVEMGVARLVFCSTSEVTLTPYLGGMFSLVLNQTERRAQPPNLEDTGRGRLLSEYAASKLRSEKIVLEANGTPLAGGGGHLYTAALRPTLLYGEQDPRVVTGIVRLSDKLDGLLPRFAGSGGRQQLTYVGNAAWAHLRAKDELLHSRPGGGIAGLPIFVTDDTPVDDLLVFTQKVTMRADSPPRCRLSRWFIPAVLSYLVAYLLELAGVPMPAPPTAIVSYLGSIILYNRLRASIHLDYVPFYKSDESYTRAKKYYTREKL
ncbi:3 beta-hydroxysteroid dehydrogenase/Delta 5--_4-isomerase type 1 isoform X2 [Periplaneta americana]